MTLKFFEEWIQELDRYYHSTRRHVTMTLDNFPGHMIVYQPTNIELIYFEPNLTSYVQPLDARIIRSFKAYYRKAFCARAIAMDDAGESDIHIQDKPLGGYANGKAGMGCD